MKKPSDVPLDYLLAITNYFSDNQMLGSGGYGEVYKGVLDDGSVIAVKKLFDMPGLDDGQFKNEFNNLIRVKHQNIIRLIGYCDEARPVIFDKDGERHLAKIVFKVLCFEYLPLGSLEKYLSEEHDGIDWHARYKIIKGICEGLDYLHGGLKKPLFHLDLKPENILLGVGMVPKIADFGLSRLFSGTHTHTTKICKGSLTYMPPEFLQKRQISDKYDVFSLGIIIIQIMTGLEGFIKYANMSPEQFVELVHKNWKERIGSTEKYAEEDFFQVKRCLEIALRCVEPDRAERPYISDIVRELRTTETNSTGSSWDKDKVAKIGMWGGVGGRYNDIEIAPQRLEILTIQSGQVIYSLEFSYSDRNGQQHTAGPWGGYGPNNGDRHNHTIKLGPTEFILEVSGTFGPFDRAPAGVITSLTFTTNASTYGPFGQVRGTSFLFPVQQGTGSIVAFFARAGWYVDAFGVYVKPADKETTKEEMEAGVIKIGPWGGDKGIPRDIKVAPQRLDSITIRSDVVVDSLEFSYHAQDGQKHTVGPWGGTGGSSCLIELGPSEFLMGVYGTRGPFSNSLDNVVTSLTLVTNARSYGPFGQGGGKPFQVPIQGNSSIVGFFGSAGSYVDAIGVYLNPDQQRHEAIMEQEAGLSKIGPWGGTGGTAHDIDKNPEPHLLQSITIRSGEVIDSIAFSYIDHSGIEQTIGPWGGPGGTDSLIRLKPLEFVQGISGTFGPFGASANVITSLTIATSQGRGYGPYGQGGGTPFNLPVGSDDSCIVGFFGRTGSFVEAIGAYVQTY